MNDLQIPRQPRLSDDEMDGMLRAFFQSEIPQPWPELRVPESPRFSSRTLGPWWKKAGRLAVAASIGLVLVCYLTLAGGFPRSNEPREDGASPEILGRPIGSQPVRIRAKTPDGREVLIWERKDTDGSLILKAQFAKEPKEKR